MKSLFALLATLPIQSLAHVRILAPDQKLHEGDSIRHLYCELIMQEDGNLIVKKKGHITWTSEGNVPRSRRKNFFAHMKTNGDLIVKSAGSDPIFKTYSQGGHLNYHTGGLYFKNNCDLVIADDYPMDIIWSNIRTKLRAGNRLRKGEMFVYPGHNTMYTLYLQHNGNLIVFKGRGLSDYHGPHDILYSADVASDEDDFFLFVTCDGRLVLKEKRFFKQIPTDNPSSSPTKFPSSYPSLSPTSFPSTHPTVMTIPGFSVTKPIPGFSVTKPMNLLSSESASNQTNITVPSCLDTSIFDKEAEVGYFCMFNDTWNPICDNSAGAEWILFDCFTIGSFLERNSDLLESMGHLAYLIDLADDSCCVPEVHPIEYDVKHEVKNEVKNEIENNIEHDVKYEVYWSMRLVPEKSLKKGRKGYSVTLDYNGFHYPHPLPDCEREFYTF